MSFNKYDTIKNLNDSKSEWIIRVRAQAVWKSVTRTSEVFRGYNIIFIDDSSERIHAFMSSEIVDLFPEKLIEGHIYIVDKFNVKLYNGDETSRAVRTEKHIYFIKDTTLERDVNPGLKIPDHSFDFYKLEDIEKMKTDNRFLTDIVAVIQDIQPKVVYTKDKGEKSHVPFSVTNGKTTINVTFFNDLGEAFLKNTEQVLEEPIIIIIAFGKVTEWKGVTYLTNFPSTRFYLNLPHKSVKRLRKRLQDPNFYVMDIEDEKELEQPFLQVCEIKKLNEDYIEKNIVTKLTVRKVDEKMNWYVPFCTRCDNDIKLIDKEYKCCGRTITYPDKRFQLYTLCSDESGTIAIVWPNDEICRITGKTVYDIDVDENEVGDGDKFPPMLRFAQKKLYKFTIGITEDNIKKGSNVYTASKICGPMEMGATNSPNLNKTNEVVPTELSMSHVQPTGLNLDSPPTVQSSNKIRTRLVVETDQSLENLGKKLKMKSVKIEKV